MAYQGEDIFIQLEGDAETNLDELKFKVVVYPTTNIDDVTIIDTFTKEGANQYTCKIPSTKTRYMDAESYNLEVLVLDKQDYRTIFMEQDAFEIVETASKNLHIKNDKTL